MTTVRTIVSDALRESGILGLGDTMEAAQYEEGLRRLQAVVNYIMGHELGENFVDYNYGLNGIDQAHTKYIDFTDEFDSNFAPTNARVVCNLSSAKTLYMDAAPEDGARFQVIDNSGNFATYNLTLDANGRLIESAATKVLDTNSQNREWFYRADLGQWMVVSDLTENGDSPFPDDFDEYLVTLLAMRLNPRYGIETRPETMEIIKNSGRRFRARYAQKTEVGLEEALRRAHPWRQGWRWNDSDYRFYIGR